MVLDIECSSSLYALNVACTAANAGKRNALIVGVANLVQSAEMHLATVKAGVLSGKSTFHAFNISVEGYGRGECIGALCLKRLNSAATTGTHTVH